MYEVPFLHYMFIVISIIISVNLVSHELVILMGKNGYVHTIFEIKPLNSNSPALRGTLSLRLLTFLRGGGRVYDPR